MRTDDLRALLDELAQGDLWDVEACAARADALDRLELATLGLQDAIARPDGTSGPLPPGSCLPGPVSRDAALLDQATRLMARLAEANRTLLARLRSAIRSGACRGGEARRTLERLAGRPDPGRTSIDSGYDLLDALVSELLLSTEAPAATLPPEPERVAYQPAPARVVLDLLDRVSLGPDDLFYDLGAGLGHVCLLVHLISGVRARGIEIEPAYCRYARQQAAALRLPGVEFVEDDVRRANLAGGTCYFMYTPFTGKTLAEVLDRLAAEARHRRMIVAAYGPCVATVSGQPWLAPLDPPAPSGLALFLSRPRPPSQGGFATRRPRPVP